MRDWAFQIETTSYSHGFFVISQDSSLISISVGQIEHTFNKIDLCIDIKIKQYLNRKEVKKTVHGIEDSLVDLKDDDSLTKLTVAAMCAMMRLATGERLF